MHGQQANAGGAERGDADGAERGEAVLAQALAAFQTALGPRLTAAYALGSLAHGGFSPLVSDVDLGLVLDDPFRIKDRFTIRSVAGAVRAGGSPLHQRLSVFWGTPSTLRGTVRGGRFPRWTGLTCWSTAGCWPGPTPATAWPALGGPSCWWRAGNSRSARWAGTRIWVRESRAWSCTTSGVTIRCGRSAPRRCWPRAGPGG